MDSRIKCQRFLATIIKFSTGWLKPPFYLALTILRSEYGIKNPYFVFARMKDKEELGYMPEQDRFSVQPDLSGTDGVFMSIEELCTPAVPQTVKLLTGQPAGSRPEAMEKLIRELIGDRLLELSRYVALDSLSKTMIIDKTSLINDGYQLVTH